jgi:hypothetical protein
MVGVQAGLQQALCGRRISGGGHDALRGAQQGCWLAPNQLHISAIDIRLFIYPPVSKEWILHKNSKKRTSLTVLASDMVCPDFKMARHYYAR